MKIQIGFLPALLILFMTLKLANVIDWSWWWVLSPLWGLPAIIVLFGLVAIACVVIETAWRTIVTR